LCYKTANASSVDKGHVNKKNMGEKYGLGPLGQAKGGHFDILLFKHDHIYEY
jgi:hypothetical protein